MTASVCRTVHDDRLRELMNDERWTPPLCDKDDPGDVYAAWLEGNLDGTIFGETGHDVVERLRSVVEDVADRCRGEAALLVSHGGIIELGLTHLCRNITAAFVDSNPLTQRRDRGAGGGLLRLGLHELGRQPAGCPAGHGHPLTG